MSSDLARQTRERQGQAAQATDAAGSLVRAAYGARTEISKALADRIGPDRFLRALATEIRTTKHLDECTTDSVLGALFVAAQLGLEVGSARGLVYLVPYRNKDTGRYEASLIIGYKGWVDLFYRARARAVQWFLIREGDTFRIGSDSTGGKVYRWEQADPNSTAPVTGGVAQVITPTGGVVWEYMPEADIQKRSTGSSFWKKWPDEMRLKTVMRRLAATAPLSDDLVRAQQVDETVQRRVEVPGMPVEQVATHVPVAGTRPAVEQRPTAPPAPPVPGPPRPRNAAETPADVPGDPEPGPEPADDDWGARERAEADAYLAEQAALAEQGMVD